MQGKGKGQTLCWRCQRATNAPGMGCSWSRQVNPEPVEGWEADPTSMAGNHYYYKGMALEVQSYVVRSCPLFVADAGNRPLTECKSWLIEIDGEWLTTRETRKRLGLARNKIYALINKGELNAKQVDYQPSW